MEVWRVENQDGEGPYDLAETSWQDEPHSKDTERPIPSHDFDEIDIKEILFSDEWIFGFENFNQLSNWFSQNELKELDRYGYKPRKCKTKYILYGGKQVVFIRG